MNFLAHLYLSGKNDDIRVGNFIADSVKGKAYEKFSPKIQQGILLHRKIDEFTDKHLITKDLSLLLKSNYSRHSGIVIDIFYDHFLSINWMKYSDAALNIFINYCYKILLINYLILPSQIKSILPFIIAKNRLLSYSTLEGLENALETMSNYTTMPKESDFAMEVLKDNYDHINQQFILFFDDLVNFVNSELTLLDDDNLIYSKSGK